MSWWVIFSTLLPVQFQEDAGQPHIDTRERDLLDLLDHARQARREPVEDEAAKPLRTLERRLEARDGNSERFHIGLRDSLGRIMLVTQKTGGCEDAGTARADTVQRHFAAVCRGQLNAHFAIEQDEKCLAQVPGMEHEAIVAELHDLGFLEQTVEDRLVRVREAGSGCHQPVLQIRLVTTATNHQEHLR